MAIDYGGPAMKAKVHTVLVATARKRALVSYLELAELMDLKTTWHSSYRKVDAVLRDIAEDEVNADRPMLCAVAVRTGKKRGDRREPPGTPGKGFYTTAFEVDGAPSPDVDLEFWQQVLEATYKAWS